MRLVPSLEQAAFAGSLHDLLSGAEVPAAADRWADGDHGPGRRVWERLAGAGVTGLAVPERWGGLDAGPADLVIAAEELGHHAVPGPVAETLAAVPALLAGLGKPGRWLRALAEGKVLGTLAAPPWLPYAVDADAADVVLFADRGAVGAGGIGAAHSSLDRTRRLFEVVPAGPLEACPAVGRALDLGALVCAAQLLGAGRALLEVAVAHARSRAQFGGPIGRFQAVRHRLADVAVGLEFARPLLYAAAVTVTPRDVSAAKVACSDAANRAARAALQVHGAIGYTQEHGLGRWLTKVRALSLSWGTPADHRARVLAELAKEDGWN
ncbi:acyl-CoA dehydrogenase family protein [Actinoplanes awajinensis]|uniref:Acyl-CoA dehydrogenase n=1 Tax=Actinoplanes awajinensis subsp. mycoplanecinus TaxID=135947 RepID=A0A0X3VB09_9ACTN|nr:acyl-CoA dehydrogenase family protein [Actinoplanes awajinensis]KUL41607.1 acyl-CoA dehydrogenase [Actinoplanes awajinensis subsp. mycoplanecinus]